MERAGLDPKVHKNVKRKLLLSNAAIQDIKENMEKKAKQGPTFACKVIKKYKCVHSFSKAAGVSTKRTRKSVLPAKKRNTIKDQLRNTVLEFLEREDNSTLMLENVMQSQLRALLIKKRILTDYMHNIHAKFLLENPSIQISRSVFYELKPAYIMHANFSSRKTCLCTRHQNMALKLRCLRNSGITCSKNPDTFIKEFDDEKIAEEIQAKCADDVKFVIWKKVKDGENCDGKR